MPNQCSFFANFLAAFRTHGAIQQEKVSSTKPSKQTHSAPHNANSQSLPSVTSNTKSGAVATTATATLSSLHTPRNHSTNSSPLSRSPGHTKMSARYIPGHNSTRRGSDSSTEGFREVLGAEKWYIGGRTTTGEEKYFKLGVIRRKTSRDRLSMDRLSL